MDMVVPQHKDSYLVIIPQHKDVSSVDSVPMWRHDDVTCKKYTGLVWWLCSFGLSMVVEPFLFRNSNHCWRGAVNQLYTWQAQQYHHHVVVVSRVKHGVNNNERHQPCWVKHGERAIWMTTATRDNDERPNQCRWLGTLQLQLWNITT